MSKGGTMVLRSAKALAVHLAIGAFVMAVVWSITGNYDNASQVLRAQFEDSPDALGAVGQMLASVQVLLFGWIAGSFTTSWLLSTLFLIMAERQDARNLAEGGKKKVTWLILLGLNVIFILTIWYFNISLGQVAAMLVSQNYLIALSLTFITVPLSYWLATGLAVKGVMRPSIPLGGLLPRFWS